MRERSNYDRLCLSAHLCRKAFFNPSVLGLPVESFRIPFRRAGCYFEIIYSKPIVSDMITVEIVLVMFYGFAKDLGVKR